MKANLQTAEPEAIARWASMDLYGQLRRAREGAPKYLLHDGPPYANGEIHIGTALNKILKDLVVKSHSMAGLRRALRAGLGLPRPADRAEGRSPARPEKAADVRRRFPPRVPGLRREVRRHHARGLQAPRRLRPLGQPVPDDGARRIRPRSCARSDNSSSRAWSTRARSRSTGACTAGRRWPRQRSNTSRTPRRRSTSSFRFRRRARTSWASACRRSTGATSRSSSGRRRRGRFRRTSRSRFIRTSNTARTRCYLPVQRRTPTTAGTVVIVAKDLAATVAARTGRSLGEPLATFEGRALERLVFEHPLYGRDSLAVIGDYVTLDAGTGAVHTAPGHGADDYHTGDQVRPRDLRTARSRRPLPRHGGAVRRDAGARRESADRSGARRARPARGTARTTITRTRTAGAATTR